MFGGGLIRRKECWRASSSLVQFRAVSHHARIVSGAYASAPLREHLKFEDDLRVDLEYFPIALEDTLENVLGASLDHQGCPYAAASTSAILLSERSARPSNLKEALALHEN